MSKLNNNKAESKRQRSPIFSFGKKKKKNHGNFLSYFLKNLIRLLSIYFWITHLSNVYINFVGAREKF